MGECAHEFECEFGLEDNRFSIARCLDSSDLWYNFVSSLTKKLSTVSISLCAKGEEEPCWFVSTLKNRQWLNSPDI